jgi:hypothetical protein
MTNQVPEILIVENGAIELPAMRLYGVIQGDVADRKSWGRYPFETTGSSAKMTECSALWRGFVSTYKLSVDGTLCLEKLEYPFSEGAEPDDVHEVLHGNFLLELRESFRGASVRIPFVDGVLVRDQSQWKREDSHDEKRLQQEWDAVNCAALVVTAEPSVPHGMQGYKVYVNGNIHGTPSRFSHLAPANGMYARLRPGSHRVVVREADHAKKDRAESNTLIVEGQPDQVLNLRLGFTGNMLKLAHSDA